MEVSFDGVGKWDLLVKTGIKFGEDGRVLWFEGFAFMEEVERDWYVEVVTGEVVLFDEFLLLEFDLKVEVDETGFGEEDVVDCLLAKTGLFCLFHLVVDFDLDFAHDFLRVIAEQRDHFGLDWVVFEDQLIRVQVAFEEQFVRWLVGREV